MSIIQADSPYLVDCTNKHLHGDGAFHQMAHITENIHVKYKSKPLAKLRREKNFLFNKLAEFIYI